MPQLPKPYRLHHLAEVDSTNNQARKLAQAGTDMPAWILADRQTAGRGRFGRSWISPQGNFMASLLMPPITATHESAEQTHQPEQVEALAQIGFVAGLALYDTLHDLLAAHAPDLLATASDCRITLKWPNDVLLGGAKLAGILLETIKIDKTEIAALAVGIGVNLAHFPPAMPYPATSFKAATGVEIEPVAMLGLLAEHFDNWLNKWQKQGFAALRDPWLTYAHGLGEPLRVQLANRSIDGIFKTLTQTGQLVIQGADGHEQIITSGDVYFTPQKSPES